MVAMMSACNNAAVAAASRAGSRGASVRASVAPAGLGHVRRCLGGVVSISLRQQQKRGGVAMATGERRRMAVVRAASGEGEVDGEEEGKAASGGPDVSKELAKSTRKIASTFAPRGSGDAVGKKNPAYKGSVLYTVFEVQAYLSLVAGALLSYNVVLPSDEPNIARLMGMWSIWMFTVPSLRARECDPKKAPCAKEKDALNVLFVAVPLINVLIPVDTGLIPRHTLRHAWLVHSYAVWKSFPAVFTADCLLMAYMYYNKGAGIFDDGSEPEPKA